MRNEPPRRIDRPEEGLFLLRLVRGGPLVGAAIVRLPDHRWAAQIDGQWCGEPHGDPVRAAGVFRIWTSGKRVNLEEFQFRLGMRVWAEKHAPFHPAANPRQPIDLSELPPIF